MSLVVSKLKVAQLKSELAARNLSTAGLKAVLAERLQEALDNEINLQPSSTAPPEPSTQALSPSQQVAPHPPPSPSPGKRPRSSSSAANDRQPKKAANRSPARRSARPTQNQSPELAGAQNAPPELAPDATAIVVDPPAILPGTEHAPTSATAPDATNQSVEHSDQVLQSDQPPALEPPLSPPLALHQETQPSHVDATQLVQSTDQTTPDRPASPPPSTVLQEPQQSQTGATHLGQSADQPAPDRPASPHPHRVLQEPQSIQTDKVVPQEAPQESLPSQIDPHQSRQSPAQPSIAPAPDHPHSDTTSADVVQTVEPKRSADEDARRASVQAKRESPDGREDSVHASAVCTTEARPKPPPSALKLSSPNGLSSSDTPLLDGPSRNHPDQPARQEKPESRACSPPKAASPVVDLHDPPSMPTLPITDEPSGHASSTNTQAERPEQRLAPVDSSNSTLSKGPADERAEEASTSEEVHDRPPETRSVYISNLVRPLTVPQIKKKLAEFGEVETFWIDGIRTHAYATFARRADAVEAYEALHQTTPWPPETGKVLSLLYVPTDQVSRLIAEEEANAQARVHRGRLALCCARAEHDWQFELRPISSSGPARPRGLASSIPASFPAAVGGNHNQLTSHKEDLAPSSTDRIDQPKFVFAKPDDHPKGGPEKWFKKTVARPHLFWAPAVPL